jgi:hypothetical protein
VTFVYIASESINKPEEISGWIASAAEGRPQVHTIHVKKKVFDISQRRHCVLEKGSRLGAP